MAHRRIGKAQGLAWLSAIGWAPLAWGFAPPTQADPPNQLTATIPADHTQILSYSRVLSFNPNEPLNDYPKIYWFKYTADGNSVVKFDTLGSDFGSQGGGVVLGTHNQSQVAVYNTSGQLMGMGKHAQDLKGDPIPIYPHYTLDPGSQNQNWYSSQGLTELYFRPNPPSNPHHSANPNDPEPHAGWAAPGNEGNSQKYYPPHYPTSLNEYHVWSTAFSYVILDNNDEPVINPGTGQPYNQPGWRHFDRRRAGPGAPWNRYDVLPAGDYYIAVSSHLPTFQGDVSGEEILQAAIHFDPSTQQIRQPILTGPLETFQYYLEPSATDQFGTIVLNVTTTPISLTTQWAVDTGGNWELPSPGNWSNGVPVGIGHEAIFGTFGGTIAAPQSVVVTSRLDVGTITFDNSHSYTISGATITLDQWSGDAVVKVLQGSHTISAPLVLARDTVFTTSASSGVALTGNLFARDVNLIKAGAGTAQFANVRATGIDVQGGTLRISAKGAANDPAGTSVTTSLSIASGAALDLTNNSLVIDYDGPAGTLISDTRQHLQSGRLTSSSSTLGTGLGYGDNAVLNQTTFAGQTVDASSILVKFTYLGDSDLDGDVDVADLGNLASNWQSSAVWTSGDFDYSGFVDVADLGLLASNWQAGVGSPLGPSFQEVLASVGLGGAAVPEPGSLALLVVPVALKCHRRRSRQ